MKYIAIAVVAGALGSMFTFVNPKTIVAWGLGFGRHNDRVLVGCLLLVISAVCIYKVITLLGKAKVSSKKAKKTTKKAKRRKR